MIRSRFHVYVVAVTATVAAFVAAAFAVLVTYPPERWPFELTFTAAMCAILGGPISFVIADLARRNFTLASDLRRMLERDRLTNTATRDHFFARLAEEADTPGVTVMVDIDHFKRINDTFGHLTGDAAIRHVATILMAETRATDTVCRFGGEEFLIFLARATLEQGRSVAERIRARVDRNPMPVEDGAPIALTVSLGLCTKDGRPGLEAAIRDADAALYLAKAGGRNRVVAA